MHNNMTPIGSIIRGAREAKGLSQAALAEKIDASTRTIIAVENDQRYPTYEILHRLVHVLDISTDLLFWPERASYTPEQDQAIKEFLACSEWEQRIVMENMRSLIRALRKDESEK